ncbi:MAG: hypothetical protein LBU32_11885 [Clostridiales bacterium]|nr:hypothetical protein [Clostridiales bacterium]
MRAITSIKETLTAAVPEANTKMEFKLEDAGAEVDPAPQAASEERENRNSTCHIDLQPNVPILGWDYPLNGAK